MKKADVFLFAPMLDVLDELGIAGFDAQKAGFGVLFSFFLQSDEVKRRAFVVVIEAREQRKSKFADRRRKKRGAFRSRSQSNRRDGKCRSGEKFGRDFDDKGARSRRRDHRRLFREV